MLREVAFKDEMEFGEKQGPRGPVYQGMSKEATLEVGLLPPAVLVLLV